MAKTTVEVEILAVLKEATKTVKDFAKETQKQFDGLNFKTAVSAINDGFELIEKTAGRAFDAVKGFVGDAITEASEGEEALTRVANSMRLVGDFTEDAVQDFKNFADAMQETTVNSDDAVLSSLALAKNFGLTNKEAKLATAAAIDFAAATGRDLDSAVQSVARTFTGFVDKDLAKYAPGLKAASKEQLILGEGARVIGERFKGFAEAIGGTFQGSVTKTKNSFSNLLETIGELIIKNPVLIQSVRVLGETFGELTKTVTGNKEQIGAFISEAIKSIAAFAPVVIQVVQTIDFVLTSIVNLFQSVAKLSAGFFAAIQADREGNRSGARDAAQQSIKEVIDLYEAARKRQAGFYDPLVKAAKDASDKIQKIGLGDLKDSKIKITVPKSEANILKDRIKAGLSEGADAVKNKIEEAFNKQKSSVESISKNPAANFITPLKAGDKQPFSPDAQNAIAAVAGGISAAFKGAAGAEELVKGFAGAVAEAFVPGLGPVVSEITGALAKGPDHIRQMVREFAESLPAIIENIAEAIPVAMTEIFNALPTIIGKLVERAPEIIRAMIASLPEYFSAMISSFPRIVSAFISEIVLNIPEIIEGFAKEMLKIPEQFAKALIDAIPGLGGVTGVVSDVGSSIGGFFGDVGDFLGLAGGGDIPKSPQFSNDGFGPVRLNAGETVLDTDTADSLRAFLSGETSGQTVVVNLTLSDQVLASQILRLNRGGFRLA